MRNILCLDLEATCWTHGMPPRGEQSEIIEIGYCAIDLSDYHVIESDGIYVKPEKSKVSPYCVELTGITQKLLDEKGRSFEAACNDMRKFKDYPWVSFGEYDESFFQHQCLERGIAYPLGYEHYNIKDFVNDGFKEIIRLHRGATKTFGLKDALHLFGMAFAGRHHSGADDARNVGRLLIHMSKMMDPEILARISSDGNLLRRKPR